MRMLEIHIPNEIFERMLEQSNGPVVKAFSVRDGQTTEVSLRIEKE